MKELVPVYRLKKGKLYHNDLHIPFSFAIVYVDEGLYFFELFVDDGYPLQDVFNANRDSFLKGALSLEACSDNGEIFIATNIAVLTMQPFLYKITSECLGQITIEEPIEKSNYDYIQNADREPILFFLKLEGMKMCFSNHTEVKAYRNHQEISWHLLQDYNWDHSVCDIQVGSASYRTIWRKDSDEEIIVEFLRDEYQYRSMPYTVYSEIKADFISVLSFLNGAPVCVRKEYTGAWVSQPNLNAQVKYIYSFKKELIHTYNNFIPLNDDWYKGDNIVNRVLCWDFNRYRFWNKKLDLNAIVYVLGNAEQVRSVYERVYIQMILLERLSDSYALIHPIPNPKLIDEITFSAIKSELETVLKGFEHKLNPNHYQMIRARLFGLNDGKRQRTDVKIVAMLEDVGIEITEEIRQVISEDRHSIIHKGDIGSGKAFSILDKLLRQVVVNLMKYTGPTVDTPRGESGNRPVFENSNNYLIDEDP